MSFLGIFGTAVVFDWCLSCGWKYQTADDFDFGVAMGHSAVGLATAVCRWRCLGLAGLGADGTGDCPL